MPVTAKLECCVCDEEFTHSRTVTCSKCETIVCKTCMKQYIEMNRTDACCLNDVCGATWTRRFLTDNFGSSYVNGKYKKMIDLNRVERVIATNPRFMEDAQLYKNMRDKDREHNVLKEKCRLMNDERYSAAKKYYELDGEIMRIPSAEVPSELRNKLEHLRDVHTQTRNECNGLDDRRYRAREAYYIAKEAFEQHKSTGGGGKGEKVVYQKACPQTDCNGFLSQKGVCGICKIHVCSKCNVKKGMTKDEIATHECKKEDIESVKVILKETKPCPRCGTRIHKIDGCDQMWCPYCQDKYGEGTTFSWKTGKIERGRIHNPHFIEHMRNHKGNLREVGDVHCGGLPPIWAFDRKLSSHPHGTYNGDIPQETRVRTMNIVRRVDEINQYIVRPLRETMRRQNVHRMNQIYHILGIDDDKTFRREIARTEKKREKDREILDIFEVVIVVLTEKINHLYNEPTDLNVALFLSFVEEFAKEENRCLADISYVYKQSVNIVNVDQEQHYHVGPNSKVRLTTKKALEHYKKTGKILQKKTKAKACATKAIDLTNE